MAVNLQFDQVEWVEIGRDVNNHVNINNVLSYADRIVSPDGDMVYPMQFINDMSPFGVHHNHKYWEIELTLDTDWLADYTVPLAYWAYTYDIDGAGHYTVECDTDNGNIDWFKVFIREPNTANQTQLTWADNTYDNLWCINEISDFNNEVGEKHQTMTWRFLCFEERLKTRNTPPTAYAKGANERPVKFMRIDNVSLGGNICTNVLRYRDEYAMQMTPQFIPNTFEGLDIKQDQKWRRITVVVDSETDIFDAYFSVQAANVVFPAAPNNLSVTFTLAADGAIIPAGTQRTWTYSGGSPRMTYIVNRNEGETHGDVARDTIEYEIITTCDRAVS